LESEEQLFTVTLDEALVLYAAPKTRGRRTAAPAPPLRELGTDPASGKPMVVRDGRFGPYVTDGETNASLRKSDNVEALTDERGAACPPGRAARRPRPRRPARPRKAPRQQPRSPPASPEPARKACASRLTTGPDPAWPAGSVGMVVLISPEIILSSSTGS